MINERMRNNDKRRVHMHTHADTHATVTNGLRLKNVQLVVRKKSEKE